MVTFSEKPLKNFCLISKLGKKMFCFYISLCGWVFYQAPRLGSSSTTTTITTQKKLSRKIFQSAKSLVQQKLF